MGNVQLKEVEIREMATLRAYQDKDAGTIDVQCQPMDIYLFCLFSETHDI